MNDLKRFRSMVSEADVSFEAIDDFASWQAARAHYQKICQLARQLVADGCPPEHVITIWNDRVDQEFPGVVGEHFKWNDVPS